MKALLTVMTAWLLCARSAGSQRAPEPGTYHFMICREVCDARDSSRATTIGELVLRTKPISIDSLPDDVRSSFRIDLSRQREPNACIVTMQPRWADGPFAGFELTSLTQWRLTTPDSISVVTFQVPEGADIATLAFHRGELRGTVRSVGIQTENVPLHHMIARRTGPPTLEPCIAVMRKRIKG